MDLIEGTSIGWSLFWLSSVTAVTIRICCALYIPWSIREGKPGKLSAFPEPSAADGPGPSAGSGERCFPVRGELVEPPRRELG